MAEVGKRPNIVLITADDMNWDAVGAFGCPVAGTTPNLDRLAAAGLRFTRAHVTIAVCQPSRGAIMTGRYPHRSGGEGFYPLRFSGVPILPDLLRGAGYRVGILGKVRHSTPYADFAWDMAHDQPELGAGRNPDAYYAYAEAFCRDSIGRGQPFFLMANSHDPHRPFYGNDKPEWYDERTSPPAAAPSRTFLPDEVTVPGFLPDLPEVRREIAEYYSSVRRCDDTIGRLLDVLDETGVRDETFVVFLSDNGMAFPFAKTNCYLNSTRTPMLVRFPGRVEPGAVDRDHFVSGIDLAPTLLDAAGIEPPPGMDGRTFLPLLQGMTQAGRDRVFTQFHQTSARRNYPMRCVQDGRFGYIFNPWSDGVAEFKNESQNGRTYRAMARAAATDPEIDARVRLFLHRVPEELYDLQHDPDARCNLIDDPRFTSEAEHLRAELEMWMQTTADPALATFLYRRSPEARAAFLRELDASLPSAPA